MAKYDPNQVCEHCLPYVGQYVQTREAEVAEFAGKAKQALTVYNFLMDEKDPASEGAYKAVKAAMEGQPIPDAKPTRASRDDDDPVVARLNDLDLRDQLRDFKAKYPHLSEKQVKDVYGFYKDGKHDETPLEDAAWIVLKDQMNPSAKKVESAPDYEPADGESADQERPVRFKENEPSAARREMERAIDKEWAELTK